jgi:ABC-2 type transport system permease protein
MTTPTSTGTVLEMDREAVANTTGPNALGDDFSRFAHLTWTLASTDFRLKFFGSALGYLWQLMRPLMLFGIIYLVFAEFVNLGDAVDFYPVVLLTGVILFTFFSEATGTAVTSVQDREGLLRKIRFPRLVIPTAAVVTAVLNLGLNLIVVLIFMLASGVEPHWSWLQAPLLIAALIVLAQGLAMLVSALYVRYRDIRPIWDVILQMTFYATPLLYPIESVSDPTAQKLVMLNPLAVIVQQMRHAVIDPSAPSAADVAGGYGLVLIPVALSAALVVIGFLVFRRQAPRIAEDL